MFHVKFPIPDIRDVHGAQIVNDTHYFLFFPALFLLLRELILVEFLLSEILLLELFPLIHGGIVHFQILSVFPFNPQLVSYFLGHNVEPAD